MDLQAKLNEKLKELETLRTKLQENDAEKQKLLQAALEVQGAAKQLVELVNAETAEKNAAAAESATPAPAPEVAA